MKRWTLVERAPVPGGDVLDLWQHDDAFVIRVAGVELMSSREHGSEDALADLGCAPIADRPGARALIGGLGMGFTLARALARLGPDAEVTVAELVPAVVVWNRGALGDCAGRPLDDPRTRLFEGDVADALREPHRFDAVLLDVDNGPEGLSRPANRWLYEGPGLAAAHRALRPGGVLAVWSVADDPAFTQRIRRAGFEVRVEPARSRAGRGSRHVVWVARSQWRV